MDTALTRAGRRRGRAYSSTSARDSLVGRIDDLSLWCGQGVALVSEILPAAEIVRRTVADAEAILAEAMLPGR